MKLTKAFSADVKVNDGERSVTAIISTNSVDRDGDVLIPQGCKTKDFEKNPVVFLNHNYWTLPVGKCEGFRRTDDAIIAKTVFAARPENHPEDQEWVPDTLFSLFQQKVLSGFSVGFTPIEARPASDKDVANFGAGCKRVFSKWNLLEYSVAPIPANQDAVATAVSKSLMSADMAEKLFGYKSVDEDEEKEAVCPKCGEKVTQSDNGECPLCGEPMDEEEDDTEEDACEPKVISIEMSQRPRRVEIINVGNVAPKTVRIEAIDGVVNAAIAKKQGRIYIA